MTSAVVLPRGIGLDASIVFRENPDTMEFESSSGEPWSTTPQHSEFSVRSIGKSAELWQSMFELADATLLPDEQDYGTVQRYRHRPETAAVSRDPERIVDGYGDHPAVITRDGLLSYRQLHDQARRCAHALQDRGLGQVIASALSQVGESTTRWSLASVPTGQPTYRCRWRARKVATAAPQRRHQRGGRRGRMA